MILKETLKTLAYNKLEASKVLYNADKFDSSIYLVGYSVEFSLKYKICMILKLNNGFPETKAEFEDYISKSDNDLGNGIKDLKEIRNHNLQKLLYFSGQEHKIKAELLEDWTNILVWQPELRYALNFSNKIENNKILKSAQKLVISILK